MLKRVAQTLFVLFFLLIHLLLIVLKYNKVHLALSCIPLFLGCITLMFHICKILIMKIYNSGYGKYNFLSVAMVTH